MYLVGIAVELRLRSCIGVETCINMSNEHVGKTFYSIFQTVMATSRVSSSIPITPTLNLSPNAPSISYISCFLHLSSVRFSILPLYLSSQSLLLRIFQPYHSHLFQTEAVRPKPLTERRALVGGIESRWRERCE